MDEAALRRAAVAAYAQACHAGYAECARRARTLDAAIESLLAQPDAAHLAHARQAWSHAREAYGPTEAWRFYGGPIDQLDPFLNAWPVDETYIDAAILLDEVRHPRIGATAMLLANERGGEANVSTGWHALEYLLWGADTRADGPGDRPASDFTPTPANRRRREYLRVLSQLLVQQLGELRAAWQPDADNYRRRFEAEADVAVRRVLTGALVLTTFELGGERLLVALETRDQEQEHSCFSDTSHLDLCANQAGIVALFGPPGAPTPLGRLVQQRAPQPAAELARRLDATTRALAAIPAPLDQAILGADDSPGRRAIAAAVRCLEAQSDALAIVGRTFGYDLPVKPKD